MKFCFTLALLLPALVSWAQLTNGGSTVLVSPGAVLYVDGTVQNNAGSTLTNAGTVRLTGDLNNTGTLTSSGTLLFAGSTNQTFVPGTATVATLTLNNTGASGQRTLALPADLTVSTALTLQSGLIRTAPTATLTLPDGATLAGEGPGQYVQGNLKVVRAAGSGVLDFGHGLTFDRSGLGQVTATRTAGLLTDNLSRGVNLSNTALKGIDRIWTVETAQALSGTLPVTLQWLADDDNGLSSFAAVQAWRAEVGMAAWRAVGSQQAATVSGATRSFSFVTPALGRLTLSNNANPLPVELLRFTARAQGDTDGVLTWRTASERNAAHWNIERSATGRDFVQFAQLAAQGNKPSPTDYALTDANAAKHGTTLYYRLQQVDTDGTSTYSPVQAIRFDNAATPAFGLYPNPATQHLTFDLTALPTGTYQVTLLDVVGRTVYTAPFTAGLAQELDLRQLAGGSYRVLVQGLGAQAATRLSQLLVKE